MSGRLSPNIERGIDILAGTNSAGVEQRAIEAAWMAWRNSGTRLTPHQRIELALDAALSVVDDDGRPVLLSRMDAAVETIFNLRQRVRDLTDERDDVKGSREAAVARVADLEAALRGLLALPLGDCGGIACHVRHAAAALLSERWSG